MQSFPREAPTARRMTRSAFYASVFILLAASVGLIAQNTATTATDSQQARAQPADANAAKSNSTSPAQSVVPDPKQVGGEPEGIVQVANLVYAGVKSSHCFADHFLILAEQESSISTSRRFHSVKTGSDELFDFPLVIMTGEGSFELTDGERKNLRQFVERGGLLLASASCSSKEWDRSFRQEMSTIFSQHPLQPIGMDHPVFNTVYHIQKLEAHHGSPRPIEGASFDGRLGVIYSPDGLNDTAHTNGCCCCGGNEITNCEKINVNILAYSLIF